MKLAKIAAGSAAVLALALTGCAAEDSNANTDTPNTGGESYEWDMTITTSNTSSWWVGAERFVELVDEKSDGRIQINLFANDQLSGGDALAGIEQLMNGDKALSYNSAIQYSGLDTKFSATAAPFLFANYDEVDQVMQSAEVKEAYSELASELGVKLLGFAENGFRQISNNTRPIHTPADVQGLKIRVAGSPLFLDIFNVFQSDPVVMNFTELFTSLQNGTVDGQENAVDLLHSSGLMEVQNYLSMLNYIYDPLLLGINENLWNSLSDADQALLQEAADEANAYQIEQIRATEQSQLADIREIMEVKDFTTAELAVFREAFAELNKKWEETWTPELLSLVTPK